MKYMRSKRTFRFAYLIEKNDNKDNGYQNNTDEYTIENVSLENNFQNILLFSRDLPL